MGVVRTGKLGYISSTPPVCQVGEFLALDGQAGALHFLQALGAAGQQDPVVCLSHSTSVRKLGCDFFNQPPSRHFQPSGFFTS